MHEVSKSSSDCSVYSQYLPVLADTVTPVFKNWAAFKFKIGQHLVTLPVRNKKIEGLIKAKKAVIRL
jgi:hypothetical protein